MESGLELIDSTWKIASRTRPGAYLLGVSLIVHMLDVWTSHVK